MGTRLPWGRTRTGATMAWAAVLLAGCAGHADLASRPTDGRTGEALARRVAEVGGCDPASFEPYLSGPDFWSFTCQDASHTYLVTTVASENARQREIRRVQTGRGGTGSPVRGGNSYVVSAALGTADGDKSGALLRPDVRDLDRFPGQVLDPPA